MAMARSLGVILMSVQHPLELKHFDDNNKNNDKNNKSNNDDNNLIIIIIIIIIKIIITIIIIIIGKRRRRRRRRKKKKKKESKIQLVNLTELSLRIPSKTNFREKGFGSLFQGLPTRI